jgi:D-arabinose 1-dehydrogenase-like Zn-dependent alcohol dehydrogenase
VITRGGVRAGSTVAVIGLGGVGIHAAQVAVATGARITGFDLHGPTLETAASMGLDVERGGDPDAEARVRSAHGGFDVAIDTVGHDDTFAQATRLVRKGGRVVGVGYASTSAFSIASPKLVLEEIEIVGSRYAHRDDLERAVALVAAGTVRPVVGMVRPLEAANEVFDALRAGDVVGRAVLDVAGVRDGRRP